jgi:hypothetical protein
LWVTRPQVVALSRYHGVLGQTSSQISHRPECPVVKPDSLAP